MFFLQNVGSGGLSSPLCLLSYLLSIFTVEHQNEDSSLMKNHCSVTLQIYLTLAPCLVGLLIPAPRPSLRAGLAESPALATP